MEKWKMDGKPGLVILHMQQGIVGTGSYVGKEWWERGIKAVKEDGIIGKQQELLKAFRNKNLPVIFVNVLTNPMGTVPAYGKLWKMAEKENRGGNRLLDLPEVQEGLRTIPELGQRSDEPLLITWLIGAFSNSGLDIMLKLKGVKTIVLTGFAAHSAVYNTLVQAADLWYSVVIPRDSTTSPREEKLGYDAVMECMAPTLSLVTTTEDVISHL